MEEQFWRMWPGEGTFSRSDFLKEPRIEKIEDEAVRKKIVDMTDEQIIVLLLLEARMSKDRSAISVPPRVLAQARRACDGFLGSALQIIGSNAPYKETYDKLEQMVASLEDRTRDGDPIALLSDATRSVATYYRIHIGNTASLNATRAAVEIYLIWANTGHLPETLPEGLPRDPYSGRAFQYKKTEDGFALGVDPDHVAYLREREFAFEVQRP